MRMSTGFDRTSPAACAGWSRAPGLPPPSLITLALGIGATSAIFTVVKAVLLTPLPYAEARAPRA